MTRSRIVVAGAGHGGLVAATHLARAGFEVLVLEKGNRGGLGWDWHDHVPKDAFTRAGLPSPGASVYFPAPDLTITSPDLETTMKTRMDEQEREVVIERKALVGLLVSWAEDAGATIEFGRRVTGVRVTGGVVSGVVCDGEPIDASLVIDAAGMDSPVRSQLPASYSVPTQIEDRDTFHAYRAYHDVVDGDPGNEAFTATFTVHFGFNQLRGISWFQVHEDPRAFDGTGGRRYIDILVGKIGAFLPGELETTLHRLKQVHPSTGDALLRGGAVARIPVRSTLDRITGDNYAAVGDAACMAKPINGSGVENAMIAGEILARTIVAASKDGRGYSQAVLWRYHHEYMQQVGYKMAGVERMKHYLATAPWDHVNFLFKKHVLTGADVETTARAGEVRLSLAELLRRMARGWSKPRALLGLKRAIDASSKAARVASGIPATWDPDEVHAWHQRLKPRAGSITS